MFGTQLLWLVGVIGGVALAIKGWELANTAYLAVNAYLATALDAQIAKEELQDTRRSQYPVQSHS